MRNHSEHDHLSRRTDIRRSLLLFQRIYCYVYDTVLHLRILTTAISSRHGDQTAGYAPGRIGETESAATIVFWFNLVCIVVAALPMPFLFQNHTGHIWGALTLGGLMGGIAQIMMTAAVRYAPVSVPAPFDYLQIVWATIWGFVLFATLPSSESMVGAVLIAAAGTYVVWRERKVRRTIVPSSSEL